MYVHAVEDQKRAPDLLGLDLQMVMNHHGGRRAESLRTPGPLQEQQVLLIVELFSPASLNRIF